MSLTMDDVDRADEIVREMIDLLDEFGQIVRQADKMTYERFKAYPKGHIAMALSNEHEFVGSNMFPLSEIVEDMRDEAEDEELEDEEIEEETA